MPKARYQQVGLCGTPYSHCVFTGLFSVVTILSPVRIMNTVNSGL